MRGTDSAVGDIHYTSLWCVVTEFLEEVYINFVASVTPLLEEWAAPGGTAIPGQPVAKVEQAPDTSPSAKNQFNIVDPRWGSYQILSW